MSVALTKEARARLDAHLEAVERQLAAAGKTRPERRAVAEDVETQAMEMLRRGEVADVEAVLARMDRPEVFGGSPQPAPRTRVLWILRIGLLFAVLGMAAATGGEMLAMHLFRSIPVVDASGAPHVPAEMDPGPDHMYVHVGGRAGEPRTVVRMPLAQRDTSGLHRTWGAYAGWLAAFLITLPLVIIASVLAFMGWRKAQFAVERAMAALTITISVLVVGQMVWQMMRG